MAGLAAFLTAKYFPKSGESLVFGNFPVNQLAEIYGTPMFVYDCSVLDLKYEGRVSPLAFSLEYAIPRLRPETLPASQELWKSPTIGEVPRRVLQETFAIASQSLRWGLQLRTASERRPLIITPILSLPCGHLDGLLEVSCACFSGTGPPPESCKSAPGS